MKQEQPYAVNQGQAREVKNGQSCPGKRGYVHGVPSNRAQHDLTQRLSGHTVMPSMFNANHIMMRFFLRETSLLQA